MLDDRDQKSAIHRKTEEERAKVILFYYSPPGTAVEMTAESEILWPIPRGVAFSPPPPPPVGRPILLNKRRLVTGQSLVSGGEGAHIASVFFLFLSSDGLCKRAVSDAARAGLPGMPGAMDVWSFLPARPFPFLFLLGSCRVWVGPTFPFFQNDLIRATRSISRVDVQPSWPHHTTPLTTPTIALGYLAANRWLDAPRFLTLAIAED